MLRIAVTSLALLAFAPASAQAQNVAPDSENGRYTFRPLGEDMLRLDGRTGQVSVCSKRPAGWACMLAPDERTALENEVVRLQGDNATLKRELITRGIALPGGMQSPQDPKQAEARSDEIIIKLPSAADIERLRAMLEKAWRRLRSITQDLRTDDLLGAPDRGDGRRP